MLKEENAFPTGTVEKDTNKKKKGEQNNWGNTADSSLVSQKELKQPNNFSMSQMNGDVNVKHDTDEQRCSHCYSDAQQCLWQR